MGVVRSCSLIADIQVINAVSIRHQRPFRAVTASDDGAIVFFNGVPFKHDKVGFLRLHKVFR